MAGIFVDPVAAGQLLFTPGLLWAAAIKDAAAAGEEPAAYLARVDTASVKFRKTPEADGIPRVINHEITLAALRRLGVGSSEGLIHLLTGPRSVGKSLMLRKVAAEFETDKVNKRRMILFDARQHGADLTSGIISYLTTDTAFLKTVLEVAPLPVQEALIRAAEAVFPEFVNDLAKTGMKNVVDGAAKYARDRLGGEMSLDKLVGAFFAACKKRGAAPIIVIDEANHALSTTDPELKRRTLDLLQLLTRVTKQHLEATVVLATSEHGLPFRLRALGYNKDHIGKVIVAEEVPPAVMKDLLVDTWGCGEHLTTALLMLYGGHVLHASAAIRELATAAYPATMEGAAAITTIVSAPSWCLSDGLFDAAGLPDAKRADMKVRIRDAMRTLVVDGFVPLEGEEDKVAEMISLANVGLVVPHGATAASVPPRAWAARTASGEDPMAVLLPSSHIMRLMMAKKVFLTPPQGASAAPLA